MIIHRTIYNLMRFPDYPIGLIKNFLIPESTEIRTGARVLHSILVRLQDCTVIIFVIQFVAAHENELIV